MEIINFEVFHFVGKCACTLQGRAHCRETFYSGKLALGFRGLANSNKYNNNNKCNNSNNIYFIANIAES